jgi:CheY-like chemotaxis protein
MAAAIAHRFNNLLGAAMGSLQVASADLPRAHPAQAELDQALGALREAAQVSGLMLAYLGQGSRTRDPLDLVQVCREALATALPSLPRAVRLATVLPATPLVIRGDAASLRGLINGLVANAWEAIAGEGEITVTLSACSAAEAGAAPHHVPDWTPLAAAYACLEVRDTGCGMDAAALQNAFDPFFTTKFTGRGLGLAVAQGTARAHEGTIAVESEPGQGSRFRLFLPLSAEAPPSARSAPAPAPRPAPGHRLALVVDDEPSMRRACERLLRKMGYEVLTAADGVEALALFEPRQAEVAFVLLDLIMPRMDGRQAMAAIRAIRPDTPVVLASGYDEAHAMGDAPADRPPVFLKKPFSWEELEAAIARACDGR